jgi:tetratricopeptide (TPR) repeat protein
VGFSGEFNEMIIKLSVLRERQTVDLLVAALAALTQKTRDKGLSLLWTQPERDEITLICRVLSNMEMPDLTVEPLTDFLDAVDDDRLAIEAALALCLAGSWKAEAPINRARKRFEQRVLFWNTVGRLFARVPDPPVESKPRLAAEFIDRAWIRNAKGKGKEAYEDMTRAIELEPRNAQAYFLRAAIAFGGEEKDMADLDTALELDPKMAKAYVRKAQIVWGRNNHEDSFNYAKKATEVDPLESTGFAACGGARMFQGRYRESIEFYTRAIELNPTRAGYYANRSVGLISLREYERGIVDCTGARLELGDLEGALNDATRIIELAPRYGWGYAMRGSVRMKRRDFAGAEYDYARAIEFVGIQGDFMYRHVESLRAQRRFDEACALAQRYESGHPDPQRGAQLKRLRECILLEKRGSMSARPDELQGMACFECAAAQLGEVDRAAPGAKFPRRLARAFILKGLATLPTGEGANEARAAGEMVALEFTRLMAEEFLYADIDAVAQALFDAGVNAGANECYDRACHSALAAAAADARKLKVLGERDEINPADFKTMPASELAKRVAELKDRAFVWLERAVTLGFKDSAHARQDTDLACIRDDSRFEALLGKMK